jgi:hypothetical protein
MVGCGASIERSGSQKKSEVRKLFIITFNTFPYTTFTLALMGGSVRQPTIFSLYTVFAYPTLQIALRHGCRQASVQWYDDSLSVHSVPLSLHTTSLVHIPLQ